MNRKLMGSTLTGRCHDRGTSQLSVAQGAGTALLKRPFDIHREVEFCYALPRPAREFCNHLDVAPVCQWVDIDLAHHRSGVQEKYDVARTCPILTLNCGL
ncbi:MAG: hypothetical protein AAF640_10420 [Pseudomonadota bacterium]